MGTIHRTLAAFAFALSSTAIAHGQSSVQHTVGATEHLDGGGVQHVKTGLQCPATLANFTYDSMAVLSEENADIVCEYKDQVQNQQLSYLIISPPDGMTVQDLTINFGESVIKGDPNIKYDEVISEDCQVGISRAISNVRGQALAPPCLVMTRPERTKLVAAWERDGRYIATVISGPDKDVAYTTVSAVIALSHQDSGQSPVQPVPRPAPAAQGQSVSKENIDGFCTQARTQPTKGVQFNGKSVSRDVLAMRPGRYSYPENGALLYYPDQTFLIRLPDTRKGIFGTDGDDMIMSGGVVGGCFVEQLSEIFERNELAFEAFTAEHLYTE